MFSTAVTRSPSAILIVVLVMVWASSAAAEVSFNQSVEVQNDTRFDVGRLYQLGPDPEDGVGSRLTRDGDPEFARNEASVRYKVRVAPVTQVRFVGDVELIWNNMSDRRLSLGELTERTFMDGWRLECDAAYIDLRDIAPGLDIRIGRQIVQFGSADMFNPTNLINADDLEDRAVFREPIANQMIRVDYTHIPERMGWLSEIIFTLIWVPIFQPSQLPGSAVLPLADPNAEIPVLEDDVRELIGAQRGANSELLDDPVVHVEQPEFSMANSQVAFRIQELQIVLGLPIAGQRAPVGIGIVPEIEARGVGKHVWRFTPHGGQDAFFLGHLS